MHTWNAEIALLILKGDEADAGTKHLGYNDHPQYHGANGLLKYASDDARLLAISVRTLKKEGE